MKYLESIRVVQFFLFERQELRLGEITGIFGPNGSGKSSMLDAVQIAMFGGNSRLVALNAQADELKTTRSIRAYCLGQYGENSDQRARDNATTYITLIWRDSITNAPLSMGVCIYSSADREKHEVLGRYILPGYELVMGDHLQTVDGEESPRDWKTFRHQLVERSKVSGEDPLFDDSQRYIQAALLALRGSDSAPLIDSFTRAFRFALRMKFDKTVDEIVRNDVLETRPTKINKFREITESFRRLAALVAQVETKINDGKRVESEFSKAAEESRRSVTWGVTAKIADAEVAQETVEQAGESRVKAEKMLKTKTSEYEVLKAEVDKAKQEAFRFRQAREGHSAHKDYGVLQTEIQSAIETQRKKGDDLRINLNLVNRTLTEAAKSTFLENDAKEILSTSQNLGILTEQLDGRTKEEIDAALRPALKAAEKAYNGLFKKGSAIERDLSTAKELMSTSENSLKRIKEGRAPLSPDVQRLLSELRDHGLHPIPVCDVVNITNSTWQPVIEAYLGRNIEALLVAADEEKEAFRLYRGLSGQRAVYGAKIAMESRQSTARPVSAGTVAELIKGTNPAAVAYLRRQFGDLLQATTDDEALSGQRTLTQDGMLNSRGELDRLRPVRPDLFRIGTGGSGHRDAIQKELEKYKAEVVRLTRSKKELQSLMDSIMHITNVKVMTDYVLDAWHEMNKASNEVEDKTKRLEGLADEEYVRLGEQERQWEAKEQELDLRVGPLNQHIGAAGKELEQLIDDEEKAKDLLNKANTAVEQARERDDYDHEFWSSQWDKLLERFGTDFVEMAKHCSAQQSAAIKRRDSAIAKGMGEFGSFLEKYREQAPSNISTDWRITYKWLSQLLERLEKTELANYRDDMDAAYRTSQETFRNDVAIALNNNLEWLEETMNRLNEVLRSCPTFSNGERYRFRRVVRPQLESLLKFVKDVASFGPNQDLLGGAGEIPEEFKQLLGDKTTPGAAGVRSPLDDYREFFEFDIEILREHPLDKSTRVVGHLSKRLGPGSGGEHRSPLYVIAGAALASAYRLDRGGKDGLRLMLLDEAFNKMDMTNIIATMRYLEELGLQVFMASPGENLGTLTAFLHRYYDILRDADINTVMLEGRNVSDEVRAKFREDLPEFNPDLVEQEIADIRAARVQQPGPEVIV